jgi:hypothetical protein
MRILTGLVAAAVLFSAPSTFDSRIRPILDANCKQCHSAKDKTSGFDATSAQTVIAGGNKYGVAVNPGHPETSPLIKMLKGELAPQMPFGRSLAEGDIARIEAWIRELPRDASPARSDWRWPFEKPVKKALPTVRDSSWILHPLDAFILSRLDREGLKPAPGAHNRTLVRRVYLDLVGVPPTPSEVQRFVDDTDPGAYERLVDRLLSDTRYWGEPRH